MTLVFDPCSKQLMDLLNKFRVASMSQADCTRSDRFCVCSLSLLHGVKLFMPRSNKLVDLPDELAELQQLRVLRCKYNSLARLPAVLSQLPLLETLVLAGTRELLMHKFLLCKFR